MEFGLNPHIQEPRSPPATRSRNHLSCDDCLVDKWENYQNCSVLCCVRQYIWAVLKDECWFRFRFIFLCSYLCLAYCVLFWFTLDYIGFCLTGPISLCLDWFLYCVLLCVVCMLSFVTRWGGPGGLKPILRNTTSFSALTLLVWSFDPQKPSPKWPIMCLLGR